MNPSSSSQLPANLGFQCPVTDLDGKTRPSASEVESSSDLSADEDSHEFVDTERGAEELETEEETRLPDPLQTSISGDNVLDSDRSSWTDLDFSVLVVLLSPAGSWLFGHDHLKNLFVVLLLIFYLHQLIEVPWKLYLASRPRRSARGTPSAPEREHRYIKLAKSELRSHEMTYLALTISSPFLGAFLLRKVVTTISGEESMHWFSTSLFVLATGVRPWSHLISRLRQRTRDLHDAVHYPSPETQLIAESQLKAVLGRVESLEKELRSVKRVMAVDRHVSEAHEEMFGAIEDVERIIKRQERKAESTKSQTEARMAQMEAIIARLESEKKRQIEAEPGALVRQLVTDLLEIPHAVWATIALYNAHPNLIREGRQANGLDHHSHNNQVKRTGSRLETIPEYADEKNVVFITANGPKLARRRKNSRYQTDEAKARSASPIDYVVETVLLPYRFSVRLLVAFIPPLRNILS